MGFGAAGGVAFPYGGLAGRTTTGWFVGMAGEYFTSDESSVGVAAIYNPYGILGEPPGADFDISVFELSIGGKAYLSSSGGPFVSGGAGLYATRVSVKASGSRYHDTRTRPGIRVGVGLNHPTYRSTLECGFHVIFDDNTSYVLRLGGTFLFPI